MSNSRPASAAIEELLARLRQLGGGLYLRLLARRDSASVTVAFAGLLELAKEGKVQAVQCEAYGAIALTMVVEADREAA